MAIGALRAARADYAISVSGVAGPDGGSVEKPVGTVWFGVASVSGARGDAAGMLCRRPRSGASSGDGLCAKSALATISYKTLDTV